MVGHQPSSLSERVGFTASQRHISKKPIWLCNAVFRVLSDKLLVLHLGTK